MGRRSRAQVSRRTGRGPAASTAGSGDGNFPMAVAALSTLAAVALFFTETIPARREAGFLRQVEVERGQVHRGLVQDLDQGATRAMALQIDVQSMLVELDRRGIYGGAVLDGTPPASGPADLPGSLPATPAGLPARRTTRATRATRGGRAR